MMGGDVCDRCGNAKVSDAQVCPNCGADYVVTAQSVDDANPYAPSSAPGEAQRHIPLSVSVSLALGLLTVLAGAFLISPGLGVGLTLLATPAYVRAVARSSQRVAAGEAVGNADRILAFVGSIGVVVTCTIAGAIAFLGTCFGALAVSANTGLELSFVLIASSLGFLLAFALVYWGYWPTFRQKRGG